MKVTQFFQQQHIKTERIRVQPNLLVWLVLQDAMKGKLEQWAGENNNKKGRVWFDEKGLIFTPDS